MYEGVVLQKKSIGNHFPLRHTPGIVPEAVWNFVVSIIVKDVPNFEHLWITWLTCLGLARTLGGLVHLCFLNF